MLVARASLLKCEDCNYYAQSEGTGYMHCCFREWGHGDWETAPCDDDEYVEVDEGEGW